MLDSCRLSLVNENEDNIWKDQEERERDAQFERLDKLGRKINRDMERRKQQSRAEGVWRNVVIKGSPEAEWEKDGVLYLYLSGDDHHAQCGYCEFKTPPLAQRNYHGIATYIPVHGGITYCEDGPNGEMLYGFDCAHGDDLIHFEPDEMMSRIGRGQPPFEFKRYPDEWLRRECEVMGKCILAAARYEPAYLASDGDPEARARVIDNFHRYLREEALGEFQLTDNFGAMLRLLSGDL